MKESDEVNFKRKYKEDVGLRSYSKIKKLKKDRSIGQVASGTVMNEVIPNSQIKKETDEYYEAHTSLMAIKEESLDIDEEKKERKINNNISFEAEVQSFLSKERAKLEPRPHVEKINMSHDVDKVPNKVDEEEDVQRLHWNVANSVKAALGKYYLKSDKLQSKAQFKTVARQLSYEIRDKIKCSFRAFNNNSLKGISFTGDNEAYVQIHVQRFFYSL